MSTTHLSDELIVDYALERLSRDDAAAVDAHQATCPRCANEIAAVREALSALPAGLVRAKPTAALRDAVLGATEPAHRYDAFARRVASLFDVDEATALRYLRTATDPQTTWESMPEMGAAVSLLHFDGGARTAGADVGIVRFVPGLRFPAHDHKGEERQLFLQGRVVEDSGREWLPGDLSIADSRIRHGFTVDTDEPCVVALVLFNGIQILSA